MTVRPYIVSELLEGEELREQLNNGSVPQRKQPVLVGVRVVQQAARGRAQFAERLHLEAHALLFDPVGHVAFLRHRPPVGMGDDRQTGDQWDEEDGRELVFELELPAEQPLSL